MSSTKKPTALSDSSRSDSSQSNLSISDSPVSYPPPERFTIESLDIEAQGIAHKLDGKVVFIEGALPTEIVNANVHRKKNSFEQGTVTQIHRESSQRVKPGCVHFGLHTGACGGCKMQHLHVPGPATSRPPARRPSQPPPRQ